MAIAQSTDANTSAVSWGAILAGGFAAASLAIVFVTVGSAVGLASISPWSDSGVSATTFKWTGGAFLVLTSLIGSAVGGYIAGRLRTKWTDIQPDEVTFRDTAHGFLAWAFAAVMGVIVLGTATTSLLAVRPPEPRPGRPPAVRRPRKAGRAIISSIPCFAEAAERRRRLHRPTPTTRAGKLA